MHLNIIRLSCIIIINYSESGRTLSVSHSFFFYTMYSSTSFSRPSFCGDFNWHSIPPFKIIGIDDAPNSSPLFHISFLLIWSAHAVDGLWKRRRGNTRRPRSWFLTTHQRNVCDKCPSSELVKLTANSWLITFAIILNGWAFVLKPWRKVCQYHDDV